MKFSTEKPRLYLTLLLSLSLTACMSVPAPEAWETNAVDYGKKVGDLIQGRHWYDTDSREMSGYYIYSHKIRSILYTHYDVARQMTGMCESTGGKLVEPNFIPVQVGPKQNYISKGCLRPIFGDFLFVLHLTGRGQNLEEYINFTVIQSYEGEATDSFRSLARLNGFYW